MVFLKMLYLEQNLIDIYNFNFLKEHIFLFQAVRKLWERMLVTE